MRNQFDGSKFAVACKLYRNMNGLTLRDMCELTGMPSSTLSFIENGDRSPTMAEFSHLCQLMNFEANFFFDELKKVKNGTK